jgi:hypothetical protein
LTSEHWIKEQIDRAEIWGLCQRYADIVSNSSTARLKELFAPSGKLLIGGVNQFELSAGERPPAGLPEEPIIGRTKALHQHHIEFDREGERAYGELYATVYGLIEVAGARRMLVRGLRYFDCYVRTDRGWLIEERHHHVHWMFEAPTTMAQAQSEREMFSDFVASQRERRNVRPQA